MTRATYLTLADTVLIVHLLYIAWVIFGAIFTRGRPWLAAVHIATILWGIVAETTSAPCPLTLAENWCEARAGVAPYHGPFLLHYLDAILYPTCPPRCSSPSPFSFVCSIWGFTSGGFARITRLAESHATLVPHVLFCA
jgi:hypothetical protein